MLMPNVRAITGINFACLTVAILILVIMMPLDKQFVMDL